MFSAPHSYARPNRSIQSGLYRQVGVESQLATASPHALVGMLFDGFIESVVTARGALREGRIVAKSEAIIRAVRIVEEGLRGALNLKAPGSLAQDLDQLYTYLAMRLTQANARNDDALLEECVRLIQPLRDAWGAIGEKVAPVPVSAKA